MFLGLRTVIYAAPDLATAKAWFTELLGTEPYFDEPFYVGFSVGGYELGLDPEGDPRFPAITYWGVPDAEVAFARLVAAGAEVHEPVREVGGGIRVASVLARGTGGAVLGVIENPTFALAPVDEPGDGPGR